MPAKLKEQLAQLHAELNENPEIDAETAALLHQLVKDIESVEPAAASSMGDGVSEYVARFDSEHPTMTAILRQIVDSLQRMGV